MATSSPHRFFAAWRVEAPFSAVPRFDGFCTLCYICLAVLLCTIHHPATGKILLMNVSAHATLYLAFSFLPYGFGATNLYWFAFVYAHHQHRRIIENLGNFCDCMKGQIRFMTAITPAYAHAYQATCLARHMPAVPHQNFRLPKLKARYPYFPNDRSTTRASGADFRGWAIYTDGGTRIVDG